MENRKWKMENYWTKVTRLTWSLLALSRRMWVIAATIAMVLFTVMILSGCHSEDVGRSEPSGTPEGMVSTDPSSTPEGQDSTEPSSTPEGPASTEPSSTPEGSTSATGDTGSDREPETEDDGTTGLLKSEFSIERLDKLDGIAFSAEYNPTTRTITYTVSNNLEVQVHSGLNVTLERYIDGEWYKLPSEPDNFWAAALIAIYPDEERRFHADIDDWARVTTGKYRLIVEIHVSDEIYRLSARFEIDRL